jgi:hypothetical protein
VQARVLRDCHRAAADVKLDPEILRQNAGPAIAQLLRTARVEAIRQVRAR